MKIAVVGCGAVGSFYGAHLGRIGQDVHFLLRSDFDAVSRSGVSIASVDGDFTAFPRAARAPEEIGEADVILIGLKTTANHEFEHLIPPLLGPHTMAVTLQNGLGNEARLAAIAGAEKVLGGLCFVCLNRVEPGKIRHLAHGRIVLGEYQRAPQARTRSLANLFLKAGIRCDLAENLEWAHWEKLVWNVPFNGLGVAGVAGYEAVLRGALTPGQTLGPCLTTDILLGDARWERLVRELMMEVITTARQLGYPLKTEFADANLELTRVMGAYKASTLLDFERGSKLELDSLFAEPWRQARQAGVDTPRLAALNGVLHALEAVGARPPA